MITCLKEFHIGQPFQQMRSVPVSLGDCGEAVLFIHADTPNLDPWSESMNFPQDTLKLTLMSMDDKILWQKDLGVGIIPGIWFEAVISFDLDGDGVDEIWYIGNTSPIRPFTILERTLVRVDPLTGKETGEWHFPAENLFDETMSHAYRYTLAAGYANGEPVLITAQGTYGDMFLQGFSNHMEPRWSIKIAREDPGARASHVFPVLDFNEDGIDEIFWGEHIISVDTGKELFCCDRDLFHNHSDIVIPFIDPITGSKYIYTCREGQYGEDDRYPRVDRVVLYDECGDAVWRWPDGGHIHRGWIARIGEHQRYVAMAMSLALDASGGDQHKSKPIVYYFDAVSGNPIPDPIPFNGVEVMPVDFDGDGYHEFFCNEGNNTGKCMDRFGKVLADFGQCQVVRSGKVLPLPGQQVMLAFDQEGVVRIIGDSDAVVGPCDEHTSYHAFMQHLMGSGYNHINSVQSCGM